MDISRFHTPLGMARITGNSEGIHSISLLETDMPETVPVPDSLKHATEQLKEYFQGKRKTFDLVLKPVGTPYQQKIWSIVANIPYGKTTSYKSLAIESGDPKAYRAVAGANAQNPIWIVIPCHRVIGFDGSMTGYAGGIHRKKWLLDHEAKAAQPTLF